MLQKAGGCSVVEKASGLKGGRNKKLVTTNVASVTDGSLAEQLTNPEPTHFS